MKLAVDVDLRTQNRDQRNDSPEPFGLVQNLESIDDILTDLPAPNTADVLFAVKIVDTFG